MSVIIEVNKQDLIRALEFSVSSAFVKPEPWQYFHGKYCREFCPKDESPSVNDFTSEAYREWMKYCDIKEDTDENYHLFVESVKDYYESILIEEIEIEGVHKKIAYI